LQQQLHTGPQLTEFPQFRKRRRLCISPLRAIFASPPLNLWELCDAAQSLFHSAQF
jgi:hypothetical protein